MPSLLDIRKEKTFAVLGYYAGVLDDDHKNNAAKWGDSMSKAGKT
jgi:hypothetical protein